MCAVWGSQWWAAEWPESMAGEDHPSMTLPEMLPVLVAAVTWDGNWRGSTVVLYSDNMGVVGSWGRGWAREARTMAVIRQLLFRAACGGYRLFIRHVSGVENGPADSLSRGDLESFRRLLARRGLPPHPPSRGAGEHVSVTLRERHTR